MDKVDSVGAFLVTVTLGEASNFVSIGSLPERDLAALTELMVIGELAGVGVEGVSAECKVCGRGVGLSGGSENDGACGSGDVAETLGEAEMGG